MWTGGRLPRFVDSDHVTYSTGYLQRFHVLVFIEIARRRRTTQVDH